MAPLAERPLPAPSRRPVLYSFRRCPYAIRARMALGAACRTVEVREVDLRLKPPELLEASAKGTVPVLVLPGDGGSAGPEVIDESLAIMAWALEPTAPPGWSTAAAGLDELIARNDGPFKHHLDRFKYASRYPGEDPMAHREAALAILGDWNRRLQAGGWLAGTRPSLADWAVLPFVRQFRAADPPGFDATGGIEAVQSWLERFLGGPELAGAMSVAMAPRRPWRSPRWLYHLILPADWQEAQGAGHLRRSTRGQAAEPVGFVHASHPEQLRDTRRLHFSGVDEVLLLTIDPDALRRAGVAHGVVPVEAVRKVELHRPEPE